MAQKAQLGLDQRRPEEQIPNGSSNGKCSEEAAVTFGVQHGSVLGPILFLAFINDMPEHMNPKS